MEDLLFGIAIGMAIGLLFVLRANFQHSISLTRHGSSYLLRFNKDVSFLNKAYLRQLLASIVHDAHVTIDGRRARFVDQDILETIGDFLKEAPDRRIAVTLEEVTLPEGIGSSH
jgi:MFS superfamily sulfate permease-like transporter